MTHFGTCPRCQSVLEKDQVFSGISVCHCGWTGSDTQEDFEKQKDTQVIKALVGFALAIALVLGFSVWTKSSHGFLPYTEFKISLNLATVKDAEKLANVCRTQKNIACVKDAYLYLASKDLLKRNDWMKELARTLYFMGDYPSSVQAYSSYFNATGVAASEKDEQSQYYYAKSLEKSGATKDAIMHYKEVLTYDKDSINLNATKGLVQLLISERRYKEARAIIRKFKRSTRSDIRKHFSQEMKILKYI